MPGTATAYVAGGEVTDANTDAGSLTDVTGTRFYTFGGATVAVRSGAGRFWWLVGGWAAARTRERPLMYRVLTTVGGRMANASVAHPTMIAAMGDECRTNK